MSSLLWPFLELAIKELVVYAAPLTFCSPSPLRMLPGTLWIGPYTVARGSYVQMTSFVS